MPIFIKHELQDRNKILRECDIKVSMLHHIFSKASRIGLAVMTTIILTSSVAAYSANFADFDGDGLSDEDERTVYHTDPSIADTDGDGINDGTEVAFWRKAWNVDLDGDGLIALLDPDSDNDGFLDGEEMNAASNPANDQSIPIVPPLFSVHNLTVGFGFQEEYQGWIEVKDQAYAHERWVQVNWSDFNASGGATRVVSGDIDGDGKDEIVIGLGPVEGNPLIPGGVFEVLDDDYRHLAWGEIGWSDYNAVNGESWPALGDIDGDGKDEIIIGLGPQGAGRIQIFDYSATTGLTHRAWAELGWKDYNEIWGETRPAAGDLDGDGKDELIVGLGQYPSDPSFPGGIFEVLDDDYTHLAWGEIGWSDYNEANGESWPTAGDIDGDGRDEIILGLGSAGQARFETFKLSATDLLHLGWGQVDWQDYAQLYGETHPSTADVDFDGKAEIVLGLGKGGEGWIDILNYDSGSFALLRSVQTSPAEYGELSGETWPTVRFSRTLSKQDSDEDGLTDEEEALLGLFADSPDTDGDGFSDGVELGYGSDPLDKSSVPELSDQTSSDTASRDAATSGVTLAWDANTETDLAGYRISYGLESGNYTTTVDVGNQTRYTLTDLTPGQLYYFAAKAYNTSGQESAYSEEISYRYHSSDKIVTISPSGAITDNTPTFSWYAVPGYSQYYLGAKDHESIKVLKVYTAEACGCANGEAICSVTSEAALLDGPSKWAVRPQNSSTDYGAWSDIISFSVN